MRRECEASLSVSASPETVWSVVADVTRVGEWSGECRGCSWIGGASSATAGARFRGANRRGGFRWTRLNEVVLADEPNQLVWRTVPSGPYLDSVEWRIALEPYGSGTRVTESFRIIKIPRVMELLIGIGMPAHRDRSDDLAQDLGRLKVIVEAGGIRQPR